MSRSDFFPDAAHTLAPLCKTSMVALLQLHTEASGARGQLACVTSGKQLETHGVRYPSVFTLCHLPVLSAETFEIGTGPWLTNYRECVAD